MKYGIKTIGKPTKPYYVITENGKRMSKERIAILYKPLRHYPFTDAGWAYYHLRKLKRDRGL